MSKHGGERKGEAEIAVPPEHKQPDVTAFKPTSFLSKTKPTVSLSEEGCLSSQSKTEG